MKLLDFVVLAGALVGVGVGTGCREVLGPERPSEPFVQISGAFRHTCAVTSAGRAYCWGRGEQGQLGNGGTSNYSRPVPVKGGHTFKSVGAGDYHTCGVRTDGVAMCWGALGDAREGQLGAGDRSGSPHPVEVESDQRFTEVSSGQAATCGVSTDGAVWCWGHNRYGQLGIGTVTREVRPVRVSLTGTFHTVAVGSEHACAVSTQGHLFCWGNNDQGQVGSQEENDRCGSFDQPCRLLPSEVAPGVNAVTVSAGTNHSCLTSGDGAAWCWGENRGGAVGTGDLNDAPEPPSRVVGAVEYATVAAGGPHTCAVSELGVGYCWGASYEGAAVAADGRNGDCREDVYCTPLAIDIGDHSWTDLTTGELHSCGLTEDGVAWCWGFNVYGELGVDPADLPICHGDDPCSDAPMAVSGQYRP